MLLRYLYFLPFVLALQSSDLCDVLTVDGHLHLTSIWMKKQYKTCELDLFSPSTYIQFERYGGPLVDKDSWLNFTFVGSPNITVAFGSHQLWYGKDHISVLTTSRLEVAMWLQVVQKDDKLLVAYAPPGVLSLTKIFERSQIGPKSRLLISAASKRGMEQVIQSVQSEPDIVDNPVRKKTIIELERRIRQLERTIDNIQEYRSREEDRNRLKFEFHQGIHERHVTNNVDHTPEIDGVKQSVRMWGMLSVLIVLVGIYISWRTYQRHKKDMRWTL